LQAHPFCTKVPAAGDQVTSEDKSAGAPPGATGVRWQMVGLLFFGTTVNYIDRANLAAAMPAISSEMHLSPETQGLVLSAFFLTYAIFQLPMGWAVDRFGARAVYAFAAAWWGLFTAATALATSVFALWSCRLLLGAGEAGAYPANAKAVARWFPKQERARATSIYDNGARVGGALSLPIVTLLVTAVGWRESFLVTGALAGVFIAVWLRYYREPTRHPRVNAAELEYIAAGGARLDDAGTAARVARVPWWRLFTYRTVWGMMLGFFCLNFVIYFFLTWFPSYLVQARGFDLVKTGWTGMLPSIVAIAGGLAGGWVSDRMVRAGASLTLARKLPIVTGMLVGSLIIPAAFVSSAWAALGLFSLSYAGLTFAAASIWCLPADVAPTPGHVASIGGIQNFASNLAGVATAMWVGKAVQAQGGNFAPALLIVGCFAILGAASYLFIIRVVEPLPTK
jgi:ACS family D-galactonate transporter-like MFS transporter